MIEVLNGDVYQWDVGRQVKVDSDVCEVHFASCTSKDAYVTVPVNGVCNIPNILLQSGEDFVIYAMCENDSCEQTVTHLRVWVKQRAKPSDYVYTETEVFSYKALEERIKNLEDNGGSSGGSGVSDVLVNGTSIVDKNGNAIIPITTIGNHGLMKINYIVGAYPSGLNLTADGTIHVRTANNNGIDKRGGYDCILDVRSLDYALKQGMCDGKGAEWSATEKAMARKRMGVGEWRYIGKVETQEDVMSMSMGLDSEGKAFNLRKVRILFYNKPNVSDSNNIVRVCLNNNPYAYLPSPTGVKTSETARASLFEIELLNNLPLASLYLESMNATTNYKYLQNKTTNRYTVDTELTRITEINKIELRAPSTLSIGKGAYFEVWGVDA